MQWEYKVDYDPEEAETAYLKALGLAGWELVAVVHCDSAMFYYWKRPVILPGTAERR